MHSIDILKLKANCSKEYVARRRSAGFRFNSPEIVKLIGEAEGVDKRTSRHEVVHILYRYGEIELVYHRNMSDERFKKFMKVFCEDVPE